MIAQARLYICVCMCVCHFAYFSEGINRTYLRFSQMIDNIVRCAQKFFGGDILKNKVTRYQNVTQCYDWL